MAKVIVETLQGNEWVPEEIDLNIDEDAAVSEETLDTDMCALPRKIAYYGELSASLRSQVSRKKAKVEYIEALASQKIRKTHADANIKLTEATVKEKTIITSEVVKAKLQLAEAEHHHRMVEAFYQALREKAALAIAICYKLKEEIRVSNSPIN